MALFQKKIQTSSDAPLYTVGTSTTVLIVGLGNTGREYDITRHNIGFAAVDGFAERNDFPGWMNKKDLKALLTIKQMGQTRVILAKPTTFMNNSGEAMQLIQHFYKVYNHSTLVVYDELALKFGSLRCRQGGSDAGHNGVKSLIAHAGDDFGRLRIGIGTELNQTADAADYVLARFTPQEQKNLEAIIKEAGVIMTEFIYSGQLPHETRSVI